MSKDNGGPAFPLRARFDASVGEYAYNEGMTLRDYFAAKAMQGMLANSYDGGGHAPPISTASEADIARFAYLQADAMLKERAK